MPGKVGIRPVLTSAQREANLGFFDVFMRAYGRADTPTRAALYADTEAYRYGRETAPVLYGQVSTLLGVTVPVVP